MKTVRKLLAALTALVLVFVMVSCGAVGDDMMKEPENAKEAFAMHEKLLKQENEILSENSAIWEKVFMAADKGMAMIEDGKNYGDFLIATIENAKGEFSDDEYTLIKGEAEKIRDIENKLTELENRFPEINKTSGDDEMSMPAGNADMTKFPSFTGKDLDGGEVNSDALFSGNAVTVVNFWFTTSGPCVAELSELDAMNKELAEKGGELIGINAFTLDGDEKSITEAKETLDKNGATYRNIFFDSDSDAGKFTAGIYAYPTTYVVDRNGNIVGDPIVGAITNKNQMEELQKQIDTAIATDSVK